MYENIWGSLTVAFFGKYNSRYHFATAQSRYLMVIRRDSYSSILS